MNSGKMARLGVLAFFWTIAVFALGVFLSRGTDGENFGKFIGTVVSAIAFIPPVLLFVRWYRTNEGSAVANRPKFGYEQTAAPTKDDQEGTVPEGTTSPSGPDIS